jgi:hypothetical protein
MNCEFDRTSKEAVVIRFKYCYFLETMEKTTKYLGQDSRSSGRDSSPGHPSFEAEMLSTRPHYSDG